MQTVAICTQLVSLVVIGFPVAYWFRCWLITITKGVLPSEMQIPQRGVKATVILPMRNEIERLEGKLGQVISEICEFQKVKLLIVESCSIDGTAERCREILIGSDLPPNRWEVCEVKELGKSKAINIAIEKCEGEIAIMMDIDTHSEGWLESIWEIMSDDQIAVVSGLEKNHEESFARSHYKKSSDVIRMVESSSGSTPVHEGGLISWRLSSMRGFSLDEGSNADDAQLALEGIRRGFRSIASPLLQFNDTKHSKHDWKRSLRRSQGLSRALIRNYDLLFGASKMRDRIAIINAISTYILVPWFVLIFSILSPFVVYADGIGDFGAAEIWNLGFFGLLFLLPQGRALLWGAVVSLVSHTQYILGKDYAIWDPGKARMERG